MTTPLPHPELSTPITFDSAPLLRHGVHRFDPNAVTPTKELRITGGPTLAQVVKKNVPHVAKTGAPVGDQYSAMYPHHAIVGFKGDVGTIFNTCNVDGFLSWFSYVARMDDGTALKHCKIKDKAFQALKLIALHMRAYGNNFNESYVKNVWYRFIFKGKNNLADLDARGHEVYSVYQHLEDHCAFDIKSRCRCGVQNHPAPWLTIRGMDELEHVQDILDGKEGCYSSMPRCRKCLRRRVFLNVEPRSEQWLIRLSCHGLLEVPFDFLPLSLTFNDAGYRLAYATYSITKPGRDLNHQFTAHRRGPYFYVHETALSEMLYQADHYFSSLQTDEQINLIGLTFYKL